MLLEAYSVRPLIDNGTLKRLTRREEEHDGEWTLTFSRVYPLLRGVGKTGHMPGSLLTPCGTGARLPCWQGTATSQAVTSSTAGSTHALSFTLH